MHELIHVFTEWLLQYGGLILFVLLVLGIVGLPIPDETLLVLSGWLIAKGKLDAFPTITCAILGSICGITGSYLLGRYTGHWLMQKFEKWFRISSDKVLKVENWYLRIGKWVLLIGYFIPVVRHLSGYIAGGEKMNLKDFMLFAYTGAIIWSTTFLCFGYFLLIQVIPKKGI